MVQMCVEIVSTIGLLAVAWVRATFSVAIVKVLVRFFTQYKNDFDDISFCNVVVQDA